MIELGNDMENKPKTFIEMKLPLVWLLSSVAIICGALLSMYVTFVGYGKTIEGLTKTVERLDTKTDTRDERLSTLLQTTIEIKAQLSEQDRRLMRNETDIKELRGNVEEIRRSQRWIPK